jgi:molybdopterin synthase catalytic subunit
MHQGVPRIETRVSERTRKCVSISTRAGQRSHWASDGVLKPLLEGGLMSIASLLDEIKKHPDFEKVGMILCHNGVVRATARDGREVKGLKVTVDHAKLEQLIIAQSQKPGIVDIQVNIVENKNLAVGDDIMHLIVAGDIRENVIPVLKETLDAIKTQVTKKTEYFMEP